MDSNLSTWFKFYLIKTGRVCAEHHLTPLKNAMEQGKKRKKSERAIQTKWEAQAPCSYLISINGFTVDPRDPRKSLRGGFSQSSL